VRGAPAAGIALLDACRDVTVSGCEVSGCAGGGIVWHGMAGAGGRADLRIEGNRLTNIAGHAIGVATEEGDDASRVGAVWIIGNTIDGVTFTGDASAIQHAAYGVKIFGLVGSENAPVIISGNTVRDAAVAALTADGSRDLAWGCTGVVITGNTVTCVERGAPYGPHGIGLEVADGCRVEGNTITYEVAAGQAATSSRYGVYVAQAEGCTISGNYLDWRTRKGLGIRIAERSSVTIDHNAVLVRQMAAGWANEESAADPDTLTGNVLVATMGRYLLENPPAGGWTVTGTAGVGGDPEQAVHVPGVGTQLMPDGQAGHWPDSETAGIGPDWTLTEGSPLQGLDVGPWSLAPEPEPPDPYDKIEARIVALEAALALAATVDDVEALRAELEALRLDVHQLQARTHAAGAALTD